MFDNVTPLSADIATATCSSSSSAPAEASAKLGWILIHHRWISPAQLQDILNYQSQCAKKLGELLIEDALISEGQLKQALREQYWRRSGYWVIE